jgi:hypothetical protein
MEKIPTVEELINKIDDEFYEKNSYYLSISNPDLFAKTIAIEFAKLHVEAALKEASESESDGTFGTMIYPDSILNCYPLENIK